MDNLFDLLQQQMTPEVLQSLSKKLRTDEETTAKATQGAFSALVQALSKNAASSNGASSLLGALDRDHDGSILNNITDMLRGNAHVNDTKAANGLGILDHVLGGKTDGILQMISKGSGMNLLKSGTLLSLLAPVVMGALGKQKRQRGLDAGGLMNLLSGTVRQAQPQRKEMDLISRLLDADGDGSIGDEMAGMGMKILGNLFKR